MISLPEADKTLTEILHAASLNTAWVSCLPIWIWLVAILLSHLAIIARIAVNNNAYHAEFLSSLDLKTSKDTAILGKRNFALELNSTLR